MKKYTTDVTLLSPDGKEELGVIPGVAIELFMSHKGIKSRSKESFKKAALGLIREALAYSAESIKADKKTKVVKKPKKVKGKSK